MSDLFGGIALGGESAPKKRGRPAGAKNKAGGDLGKWFAHMTQGLTPGQQSAAMVAVTPRDIREAKKWAKAKQDQGLSIDLKGVDPVALAWLWKAEQMARLMGWDVKDALTLMERVKADLMPYVHRKQGAVEVEKPDNRPTILTDGEQLGGHGNPSHVVDFEPEISFAPLSLTPPASHIDDETQER